MEKKELQQDVPPPPAYSQPAPHAPGPPAYAYGQNTVYPVVTTQVQMAVPPSGAVRYDVTPVRIICQHCQAEVVTATKSRVGVTTFLACGCLAFVGCIFGCCLIPFFVDSLKDTVHICPNCDKQVGIHRHI